MIHRSMRKRASGIYLTMTLAFIAGLWAILRLGRDLTPPPNVAGDWVLSWEGEESSMDLPRQMNVSQSGRYLSVSLGGKGASEQRLSGRVLVGETAMVQLHGDARSLEATILPDGRTLHGVYKSAGDHRVIASRAVPPSRR